MRIVIVKCYASAMTEHFTISVVATIDPVVRASTTFNLACDRPSVVTVTHDILDGYIRRVVADSTGTIESELVELEHACLSCAIREDVIPTLMRLHKQDKWTDAVVALPVTAEPAPLLRALDMEMGLRGVLRGARYGTTLAVVDGETLPIDAFDDTYLVDKGSGLHEDDDRVTAEALAPLLAVADCVVLASDEEPSAVARAAAHHLRGDGAHVIAASLSQLPADLLAPRGKARTTLERANPLNPPTKHVPDDAGVWTLHLSSPRPFHPERLRNNLHRLANHPVRSRGVFWVPSRPGAACQWDGAGRQLSVGECGRWGRKEPRTHLIVTGTGPERDIIAAAFEQSLAKEDEISALMGPGADALEDWFGVDED